MLLLMPFQNLMRKTSSPRWLEVPNLLFRPATRNVYKILFSLSQ